MLGDGEAAVAGEEEPEFYVRGEVVEDRLVGGGFQICWFGGGRARQGGDELESRDVQSMAPAIILVPTPEPDYPTQSIVGLMLKRNWICPCQGSMETPPAVFRLPNTSVITRNFVRNLQGKRDGFFMVISKLDPKNTFVLRNSS